MISSAESRSVGVRGRKRRHKRKRGVVNEHQRRRRRRRSVQEKILSESVCVSACLLSALCV